MQKKSKLVTIDALRERERERERESYTLVNKSGFLYAGILKYEKR
jgi:hypothetical protein